jgi:hypothetical protein
MTTQQQNQQEIRQHAQSQYKETGSPLGVMSADELVYSAQQKWNQIQQEIPLEQRQEFGPVFEALLSRVATSNGAQSQFLTATGSSSR